MLSPEKKNYGNNLKLIYSKKKLKLLTNQKKPEKLTKNYKTNSYNTKLTTKKVLL